MVSSGVWRDPLLTCEPLALFAGLLAQQGAVALAGHLLAVSTRPRPSLPRARPSPSPRPPFSISAHATLARRMRERAVCASAPCVVARGELIPAF